MNQIYKVIWSRVKRCYVVVSEIAGSNGKNGGVETDPPLSAGIVTDEQTESVRRHKSIFSQIGQGSLPWPWSWDSSFAMKKKDRAKVRTKAALMKSAVSFLRYAMIPPF